MDFMDNTRRSTLLACKASFLVIQASCRHHYKQVAVVTNMKENKEITFTSYWLNAVGKRKFIRYTGVKVLIHCKLIHHICMHTL